MGYTSFTVGLIQKVIDELHPKTVMDFGAQNLYNQPMIPAPYASEWYKELGIDYECIDLSKENNCWELDLSKPFDTSSIGDGHGRHFHAGYDMVVDAGTSEHIGMNGAFDWNAIYNVWVTKHKMLRVGGVMVNENPKSGNWPGHGFQYYTTAFYTELCLLSGYKILDFGEHPAMGNTTDGWNVYAVLYKESDLFPLFGEFKTFSLKHS